MLPDLAELEEMAVRVNTESGASVRLGDVAVLEIVRDGGWARPWTTSAEFYEQFKDIATRPRFE